MYAVVTGATSGIGLEYARLLAMDHYDLILVGRRKDRLDKLKEEFERLYHIKVVGYKCDLSDLDSVQDFIEYLKNYRDIFIVVNCAGYGKMGYVEEIADKDQLGMINTNITSLHLITKYFATVMKKGHIVNISSIAGTAPTPYMTQYGATKAYVLSLSLALNYEMKKQKKDVTVLAACPGPVDTEFGDIADASFKFRSISAKKCAKIIYRAMKKKKSKVMVTWVVKLSYIGLKILPDCITLPVEYHLQKKKTSVIDK